MIGNYLIFALVLGIAVTFVASIHYFWLRDEFKEGAQPGTAATNGRRAVSPARAFPRPKVRGVTPTQVPAISAMEQRPGIMNEHPALRTTSCNITNT